MAEWSVETWAVFVAVCVTPVIAALTTMAVKIINALMGVERSIDRAVEAANGLSHELMAKSAEAAHAQGVLAGMEQHKAEVTIPVAVPEVVLAPKQEKDTKGRAPGL